jgi:hypothetical protein
VAAGAYQRHHDNHDPDVHRRLLRFVMRPAGRTETWPLSSPLSERARRPAAIRTPVMPEQLLYRKMRRQFGGFPDCLAASAAG